MRSVRQLHRLAVPSTNIHLTLSLNGSTPNTQSISTTITKNLHSPPTLTVQRQLTTSLHNSTSGPFSILLAPPNSTKPIISRQSRQFSTKTIITPYNRGPPEPRHAPARPVIPPQLKLNRAHLNSTIPPSANPPLFPPLQCWSLLGWLGASEANIQITEEQKIELQNRYPWADRLVRPKDSIFFPPEVKFIRAHPLPPERDRTKKDKYGYSVDNIYRYCTDERLHEKFQVTLDLEDIHHNINDYHTFIEKERFYVRRDNIELANLRHIYSKRLLQLHNLLGIPLQNQEKYERLLREKIRERLLAQKRLVLFNRQSQGEIIAYEEFEKLTVSEEEIDADPDSKFFHPVLATGEIPLEILPPHLAELVLQQQAEEKALNEATTVNVPVSPGDSENPLGSDSIPTKPRQPLFPQLAEGNLDLLPPEIREYLEQVRSCVSYSLTSIEDLSHALNTLHTTFSQFDKMVMEAEEGLDFDKTQNLLACQAAFATGLRQVIFNVLKHSNDTLYKFENFFTPSTTRYLAGLVYYPEQHQDIHEITPFHPNYYDEFTPQEVADEIKRSNDLKEARQKQKYFERASNKLLQMAKGSVQGNQAVEAVMGQDGYNDDEDLVIKFPQPPLLAIDKARMNEAVQTFAQDITEHYAPISFPYKEIVHKWHPADQIEVNLYQNELRRGLKAIPPPKGYRPRPEEYPFFSGFESAIPEEYKDAPNYGWINGSMNDNSKNNRQNDKKDGNQNTAAEVAVNFDDIVYADFEDDDGDDTELPIQFTPLSRDAHQVRH